MVRVFSSNPMMRFGVAGMVVLLSAASLWLWGNRKSRKPMSLSEIKVKAEFYQQQKNWPAVIEVLEQVPEASFAKQKALLVQGRAYWELSNGPAMERVLERCIAKEPHPEHPNDLTLGALGSLGDHYLGQERFDEAKAVIWRVFNAGLKAGHPDPFYLILLLRIRLEATDPSVAIERLQKFLDADPQDADAHRAMGIYLSRLYKLQEAEKHLQIALAAQPQTPRFLDAWLNHLFLLGDYPRIERVLAELPSACDEYPQFWVYRGKVAAERRNWEQAVTCFRHALELEPGRLDATHLLASSLKRAENGDEAQAITDRSRRMLDAYTRISEIFNRLSRNPAPTLEMAQEMVGLCLTMQWERESRAWQAVAESLSKRGAG